jgi:AcrR family transcriptional regulator
MSEPVKPRRPYRSERRREGAEQTRRRILDSAAALFVANGFAGTTIAAVAAGAGTAAETVYAAFGSKVALLEALVRAAARGEDGDEILEQEGPRRLAASGDQREQLRIFAKDVTDRLERVGPLLRVLSQAAAGEPALAEAHHRVQAARLRNLRTIPEALRRNGPLRMDPEDAAETIWALASPDVHGMLTDGRGWSRERYTAWLADVLAAALLGATSPSGPARPA